MSQARQILISAALKLFAEKGFAGASTRDICEQAGVNLSAIRYYFGDKGGLYRAVYTEPLSDLADFPDAALLLNMPLATGLDAVYRYFLEPIKRGEVFQQVMTLHFREMIEPTGAWQHEIDAEIRPQHQAMVEMLTHHLGLRRPDTDVHRLAFSLFGLAVFFYVGQDVVNAIQPTVLKSNQSIDSLRERLVQYAVAMVHSERKRRAV